MRRSLGLCTVFLAAALGCGKNDGGPSGDTEGDPNASYTLKLRTKQTGEKYDATETITSTTTSKIAGKNPKTESVVVRQSYAFKESVLESAAGFPLPTKLTRSYKTAERSDRTGKMKPFSFAGKSVLIERRDGKYIFIDVGGGLIPSEDLADLNEEFNKAKVSNPDAMMPREPVKLKQVWTINPEVVNTIASSFPFPIDPKKIVATGQLVRVYTRDGKQWGVIELKLEIPVQSADGVTGNIIVAMTLDTIIDGSAHAGTMKIQSIANLNTNTPQGAVKLSVEGLREKSVTPLR